MRLEWKRARGDGRVRCNPSSDCPCKFAVILHLFRAGSAGQTHPRNLRPDTLERAPCIQKRWIDGQNEEFPHAAAAVYCLRCPIVQAERDPSLQQLQLSPLTTFLSNTRPPAPLFLFPFFPVLAGSADPSDRGPGGLLPGSFAAVTGSHALGGHLLDDVRDRQGLAIGGRLSSGELRVSRVVWLSCGWSKVVRSREKAAGRGCLSSPSPNLT